VASLKDGVDNKKEEACPVEDYNPGYSKIFLARPQG
jgi:hypothetical protein